MALHHYLPQDRLRALAENRDLRGRTQGSALFADICGFTALTEALALRHGERRGVEALTQTVGSVYDALITEVERFGGSVLTFAGDAITCWFDAADDPVAESAIRAVQAALAMQAAMQGAGGGLAPLALKVSVASGPARRFTVGDEAIHTLDVLAGATVARVAMADALARPGDILLDPATAEAVRASVLERREHEAGFSYAVVDPAWRGPAAATVTRDAPREVATPPPLPPAERLRPWVLPFVFEREISGQGLFVTDLRPVVALFLRFGGLGDEFDDEAVLRLDHWIRGAQRILQTHGGVLLELTMGDKGSYLYAAFGAAQAHEDDARRALRAALALRDLFDAGSIAGSIDAGASIGLASGTLRVGGYGGRTRQSFGAQGDAVNAAARLMMLARPGEILTSGRVRGALAHEFTLQARAPIALKGKAEPMPVFALQGLQRPRAIRLQESEFVLPMVGRGAAVEVLERELDRVPAGRGAVVTAVAEAGIGKSRLLSEGIHLALQRGFVGFGDATVSDGVRTLYRPWKGVWAALLNLDPAQSARVQARAVETAMARLAGAHAEAWPLLGAVLGLDLPDTAFTRALAPKDRKALLEALLVEALRAAAADAAQDGAGVLLVLEDLHGADPLSLDLLGALVHAIDALPVLMLLSRRPPEGGAEADKAPLPARSAAATPPEVTTRMLRIDLAALDPAQAQQLIRAKLAAQFPERAGAVPPALIERIVERAQGNPLYIEELLNHLHDRGLDPQRIDTMEALDWPTSLHSLVLSRIDRLSVPQQLALKVASVIGRTFCLADLLACHPAAVDRDALHADLLALVHLGLTTEAADTSAPAFLFRHRLTLEVAYDSIAHASRVRLHALVAQHLEDRAADTTAALAPTLAHHWARAERPDKAWPHKRRAAEQAAASYANEEALACLTQVLAWLPADALTERVDTLLRRESIHDLLGRHDDRRSDLAELDALAGRFDDAVEAARLRACLALRRAQLEFDVGNYAAAAAVAQASVDRQPGGTGQDTVDPTHEFEALLMLARATFAAGQAEQARAPLDRALALARRHGQARSESLALAQLGLVQWQAGRYDAAEALLRDALPGLRDSGDLRRELDVLNNLGVVAKARARFAQAVTHYEQAQAIARRIGDRSGEAMLLNNMASASLAAGDFHRAAVDSEQAARIWAALHEPSQRGAALCNRAEAHRELGQYAAAQTVGEQALAMLRASGVQRLEATVLENLGRVAAAVGDGGRAMQALNQALAIARDNGVRAIEASTLLDLGRLHTSAGEFARARDALHAAGRLMAELGDPLGALEVQAARADLALRDSALPAPGRATAARDELAPLLPRLLAPGAGEGALPMQLYLVGWRVLVACGDDGAAALLACARAELRERAARIPDPAVRRDYLRVAEHRALLAE